MVEIYNPGSPRIGGLEWVPIREFPLQMSRYDTPIEQGFTFSAPAPFVANRAFFYINRFADDFILYQPYTVGIYPRGTEADVGPIQRVVANVASSSTLVNTGSVGSVWGAHLVNCGSVEQALYDPSGDQFIELDTSFAAAFELDVRFNMTPLAAILNQKRIVAVNILIGTSGSGAFTKGTANPIINMAIDLKTSAITSGISYPWLDPGVLVPGTVNSNSLGDTNYIFGVNSIENVVNIAPWDPNQLQRFGSLGADMLYFRIRNIFTSGASDIGDHWEISYIAMEVLFCEERRVATGSRFFGPSFDTHFRVPPTPSLASFPPNRYWYNFNANQVQLYIPSTTVANPVLPAGDYTITLAQSSIGNPTIQSQFRVPPPTLQTARQLYEIPNLTGIVINHPIPTDERIVGETFTSQTTNILPQLSLWSSGSGVGTLIGNIHAYGRQTQAQVAAGITATQNLVSISSSYDFVRFYARRFGTTSAPLVLTTPTLTGGGTSSVLIAPDEFDLLDPIVDGWKEITLPFPAPVTVSGGTGSFQWSSSTALGARWEVLGASALALSGAPDNQYIAYPTYVPYANTYGGTTARETYVPAWIPRDAVTPAADTSSDAVLMLASKYTATTLSLSQLSQPLTGIGQPCGVYPNGVPTALTYNFLSWPMSNSMFVDAFDRNASASWGGDWNASFGTVANFSVNGSQGLITATGGANWYLTSSLHTYTDVDMTVTFALSALNSIASITARQAGLNHYRFDAFLATDSTITLTTRKIVAGVATNLVSATLPWRGTASASYKMRVQLFGTFLRAKVWPAAEDEPPLWQEVAVDSTYTSGTVGLGANISAGTAFFEDFLALPYNMLGSTIQLERMDALDSTWKVIMKATDLHQLSFNDYEARIGILTSYRLRLVDQYEFNGDYSNTVTSTIAAPGVTANNLATSGQHVMTFTSNERQSGAINLAYSNAWDSQVNEDFSFPEAGFVQLQAMYNKDFYTAFHPLERGGDQFSRSVLVQAAAIAAPTLPGFSSLQDMAWDSVSYICVRDEGGNRWFANVAVPSGAVNHNRQLYIAAVNIAEVTDTPSQVDP